MVRGGLSTVFSYSFVPRVLFSPLLRWYLLYIFISILELLLYTTQTLLSQPVVLKISCLGKRSQVGFEIHVVFTGPTLLVEESPVGACNW